MINISESLQFLSSYASIIYAVLIFLFFISLIKYINITRAFLAASARALWCLPLILSLYPKAIKEDIPQHIKVKTIQVLVDDSDSMQEFKNIEEYITNLENLCLNLGCKVKKTLLSNLHKGVSLGYTPLSSVIFSWVASIGSDPYIVFTDSGDWYPSLDWSNNEKILNKDKLMTKPLLISFNKSVRNNFQIDGVSLPAFSFEEKVNKVRVNISRESFLEKDDLVQLQIFVGKKLLQNKNVYFNKSSKSITVDLTLPALSRGEHLLKFNLLPVANEKTLWDNVYYKSFEILPNTIGVLHLLGSPSWDGRYLRRYLKAEPKYDIISFFILRDPWDSQLVNSREMSLIPFPVERLFNEELPNFKVIVMQNFSLSSFLREKYQKNLVKYVKDGGSLFFLGGNKALAEQDIFKTSFKQIIPFDVPDLKNQNVNFTDQISVFRNRKTPSKSSNAPYFEAEQKFEIIMAKPTIDQRLLANLYDKILLKKEALINWKSAIGLHNLKKFKFKDKLITPILNAKLKDGTKVPLVVASYPGKGRAVWVFTDSLWKLAQTNNAKISRQVYESLLNSIMTWLTHQEGEKTFKIAKAVLQPLTDKTYKWKVELEGSVLQYFKKIKKWQIEICNNKIQLKSSEKKIISKTNITLSGVFNKTFVNKKICSFIVKVENELFGELVAKKYSAIPELVSDKQINTNHNRKRQLAQVLHATMSSDSTQHFNDLKTWLKEVMQSKSVINVDKQQEKLDYYWVIKQWWVWLLILCMPLEVVIRKWHELF